MPIGGSRVITLNPNLDQMVLLKPKFSQTPYSANWKVARIAKSKTPNLTARFDFLTKSV